MKAAGSVLLLVLSAVVLAGCSSEPQRYNDISDLASAVESAGVECGTTERGAEAQLVADSATCAGSELTLFLFESPQDLEDWTKVATRLGPTLIGSDWAVTGGARDLDRVSSVIGGDF